MLDFMNWFLLFVKDAIVMLFGLVSIDGYSLGNMLVAIGILGVVISSTIGAVALASRMIKDNSYAESREAKHKKKG